MCGIAGLVAPGMDPVERAALVRSMVDRLRHRGPVDAAFWNGDGASLGLTRLAIVAPERPAAAQANERGDIHSVVNGEFYDHVAARARLAELGHAVPAWPDTAIAPHLYEQYGLGFAERLDGMFAAAVWDAPLRRLVLARDRAGEKPLFYATGAGRFAFASEPSALLLLPWVSRDPSPEALARYLAHGFLADEDSAFADLRQLRPGHVLEWRDGGVRIERYWRPWDRLAGPHVRLADAEAAAATRERLAASVAACIPGDVPFGVFLSGGVDSGLVATLAARAHGARFPTFSLRLPERGYDESALAREVAGALGTEHHEITLDAAAGEEALDAYAARMDQPLGDPSLLPTWALARRAAQHVPVVLTGEGGDELFAGYPTYLGHRWGGLSAHLPGPLRAALVALARRLRPRHHHVTVAHVVERFLAAGGVRPFERHLQWFGTATVGEAYALLAPALRLGLGERAGAAYLERVEHDLVEAGVRGPARKPALLAYQLLDFETYLSGDLLAKVDRCTMDHGLESRAPFLHHPLVTFALGLPADQKLRGGRGKWVLKEAARGLLPDAVLDRRKQGFSPPFSAWARGPWRGLVRSRLDPARVARAGVLDPARVGEIVASHLGNRAERGRTLWMLLSLQMWAERWLGPGAAAPAGEPAAESAALPAGAAARD